MLQETTYPSERSMTGWTFEIEVVIVAGIFARLITFEGSVGNKVTVYIRVAHPGLKVKYHGGYGDELVGTTRTRNGLFGVRLDVLKGL